MISQPITCVCIYIANERKGTKIKIPNKISHLLGRKVNVNTLSLHFKCICESSLFFT